MTLSIHATDACPETAKIESFLLSLDGVVDASVWLRAGTVLATVTLIDGFHAEADGIQSLCRDHLGEQNTPHMILLQRALRPAA